MDILQETNKMVDIFGENNLEEVVLLPGCTFCPTATQLVVLYLKRRILGMKLPVNLIPAIDVYARSPHQLPFSLFKGGKRHEWNFFAIRRRGGKIFTEDGYYDFYYCRREAVFEKTRPPGSKRKLVGFVRKFHLYYGRPSARKQSEWTVEDFTVNPDTVEVEKYDHVVKEKLSKLVICKVINKELLHGVLRENNVERISFPQAHRFHPTDWELVVNYLKKKILGKLLPINVIPAINVYSYSPDKLPSSLFGVRKSYEWFFFAVRRSGDKLLTEDGYYDFASGASEAIYEKPDASSRKPVGFLRKADFYYGRPPVGNLSKWTLEEFSVNPDTLQVEKNDHKTKEKLSKLVICKLTDKESHSYSLDDSLKTVNSITQKNLENSNKKCCI